MSRETLVTQKVPQLVTAKPVGLDDKLVMKVDASSAAAEQFRVLARRLEPRLRAGAKRIAVTSAAAGEGRSTTAANLALALAAGGRMRVALVDGDARTRSLQRMFLVAPRAGLHDVVAGSATLDEALVSVGGGDEVSLLQSGLDGPRGTFVERPHALYASRKLAEVMAELAGRFDAVIVDAPPVFPTADLLGLGSAVDALLFVVRARTTSRDLVARALAALGDAPVAGLVLNGVETQATAPFELYARHDREAARARSVDATIQVPRRADGATRG